MRSVLHPTDGAIGAKTPWSTGMVGPEEMDMEAKVFPGSEAPRERWERGGCTQRANAGLLLKRANKMHGEGCLGRSGLWNLGIGDEA